MTLKRRTAKAKRFALICSALALLSVAVALVLFALRDNIVFFYAPSELAAKDLAPGTHVRIGGLVKRGSFVRDGTKVHFTVTDGKDDVGVVYDIARSGALPDLFREGQGVVAEGTLGGHGLIASTVLAKHDERYMPREVVDALKKRGVWQDGRGVEAGPGKPMPQVEAEGARQ